MDPSLASWSLSNQLLLLTEIALTGVHGHCDILSTLRALWPRVPVVEVS